MAGGLAGLLRDPGASKRHLVCMEVNPPRGTDIESVLKRFAEVSGIDFVNVTDSALAKMRLSSLMFAAIFKSRLGIEPLVNLSCRDRNIIALQSELLGAWALGVKSIIALTGDAVTVGDLPDAKGVFEVNSIGLLNIVNTLNQGRDLANTELKGVPSFTPGVVVNPNARNKDAEIRRLVRKREAGAVYALSQPVFDADHAVDFFRSAAEVGVELFVGVLPFKSAGTFEGISKVPGIKIPETLVQRVGGVPEADVPEVSFSVALEIAERVAPYVRGYHVVAGGTPLLALSLCERLVSWIQSNNRGVPYEASRGDDLPREDLRR